MRLGLCCTFVNEPIRFRTVTAKTLRQLTKRDRTGRLREIAADNADALRRAIEFCGASGIGCFRINSQILPLVTHPTFGYSTDLLGKRIQTLFKECRSFASDNRVRLTFHPYQFVVLSSPSEPVLAASLAELEYQAEVADWIGADVITIHGGGAYGDKPAALTRFANALQRLSKRARIRLAVENDDRTYTPADLLPLCEAHGLPLVYDIHHHRCNPDGENDRITTQKALATWNREPLFHISSPKNGWHGDTPRSHADYISMRDIPRHWDHLEITLEVEAKAKELAVQKLQRALARRSASSQN